MSKVLVLGQSGNGKTYIAKTADREKTGFINLSRKPLPFKGSFKFEGKPKTWSGFLKNFKDYIENKEVDQIFIDDITMGFDLLLQEAQKNFKGFDVFTHFNKHIPELLDMIRDSEKSVIITGHDEVLLIEGYKQKRAKIHGKQFEGLFERYFTNVFYAGTKMKEGKPEYFLKTFEPDTSAKCAEDLFNSPNPLEIPNDAQFIFSALKEYYG
jgi:hypothetical protein